MTPTPPGRDADEVQARTIRDFGRQWTAFPENRGYYASLDLFEDIVSPLLALDELAGAKVAEIGSGTGRIVRMLLDAKVSSVLALEPSAAFEALRENTRDRADRVQLLRATGEQIPPAADLDFVFSIGVLHHIPRPEPVVQAALRALRPGGRICIWVYGREGNELLLAFLLPLRTITQRLPHVALTALSRLIDVPLLGYMALARALPVPLGRYLRDTLGRFGPAERRLVIYDQLNPAYAKYYTRAEAYELLRQAGFDDVRLHHRHGYSWTAVGTRPMSRNAEHS